MTYSLPASSPSVFCATHSSLIRASFPLHTTSRFACAPATPRARWVRGFGLRCSYAEAGTSEDSRSATIDVTADVRTERVWLTISFL
uniref:Uncharacterized protein n=1 Tax=Kalanchoe fedtschenkoi TaxID=63787 RepID=A0A7N0UWW7_KALFE